MSRSWPIWVDVTACAYKGSKSYGARDVNEQTIFVGTSAFNSHELVTVCTTRKEDGDDVVFKFGVDGKVIKTIRMNKKNQEVSYE